MHPSLVIHNPIVIRFSQLPQRLCLHILFFLRSILSSAFYLVVHQHCNEETNTCVLTYKPVFSIVKLALGRMPINIHKEFACRYPSNNIYTVVEEWTHGYFLPRILLFLDTLLPREGAGSESVAAVCSGFCARFWVSWRKLQRSPCEHWPSSFLW